jgi:hypothetical protein
MDILFGTYRCPDHEPESFGLRQPVAETYLEHMVRPLLPQEWTRPVKEPARANS